MLITIFALLILFQFKHYIADYPLQGEYMLGKFKPDWGFVFPLSLHCLVHAGLTLLIISFFSWDLWWLAVVDFTVHFVMDRIKAGPNYWGKYKPHQRPFWMALGFDQMVHHLTHYYLIWEILNEVFDPNSCAM